MGERAIVAEILEAKNRDEAAAVYARALRIFGVGDILDWKAVNEGILSRWSTNGLVYIKEKAWKIAERPAAGEGE